VWIRGLVASVLAVALNGCSSQPITQTAFQRVAGEAASVMSAAAYTLEFVHSPEPKLTAEYGQAAVINYLDLVSGTAGELPTLQGAPDPSTLSTLKELLDTGVSDLRNACLSADCDWQSQVQHLHAAADALEQATE